MADNTVLNAGTGGDTIATDDLGAYGKVQRVKPNLGADGTAVDAIPVSNGLDTAAAGVQAVGLVAQLDDASTGTVTENQFAPVRLSARRALLVEGVAGGTAQPVSGTVTATQGTGTNLHMVVDSGTVSTITNVVHVDDNSGNLSIDDGGNSITVDGTVTASNTAGDIAHDGVNSGNPVQIGVEAIAHGTNPTAVSASGDRTKLYANRAGVLFVMPGHPNVVTIELAFTAAQTDTAIVTIGAGLKIVVTRCSFVTSHANTVDVAVRVGFGTANTPTTTGVVLTHPNVAAGSGLVEGNGGGMLGVGADNEDLRITATVPTTGSARVLVTYYTVES